MVCTPSIDAYINEVSLVYPDLPFIKTREGLPHHRMLGPCGTTYSKGWACQAPLAIGVASLDYGTHKHCHGHSSRLAHSRFSNQSAPMWKASIGGKSRAARITAIGPSHLLTAWFAPWPCVRSRRSKFPVQMKGISKGLPGSLVILCHLFVF
jgi:hypothetical protein